MPILTIPNTFTPNTTAYSSEVNANFTAISTLLNSTKLDSSNIQSSGVATDNLADGAVTTVKIADSNVTTAKIAALGVTTAKIADANVTTAKIADGTVTLAKISARTVANPAAQEGIAKATSSGSFTSTNTNQLVTNQSITLTSAGRPVRVFLNSAGGTSDSYVGFTASAGNVGGRFKILRDGVVIANFVLENNSGSSTAISLPPSTIDFLDIVAAGTYVYTLTSTPAAGSGVVTNCSLCAYEMA